MADQIVHIAKDDRQARRRSVWSPACVLDLGDLTTSLTLSPTAENPGVSARTTAV